MRLYVEAMVSDSSPLANLQRGRRASARLRLRLAARLVLLDSTQRCILTDLSQGGARLVINEPICRGAQAVLMWGAGLEAFGEVAWHGLRHCGLVFDEPLADTLLQATRDLDAIEHLAPDRDLLRGSARAFVRGTARL